MCAHFFVEGKIIIPNNYSGRILGIEEHITQILLPCKYIFLYMQPYTFQLAQMLADIIYFTLS